MLNSSSVLGPNPTKAFGFSVEGWFALKEGICLPFQKNKFEQYAIYVTQAQDLHENFPHRSCDIQIKMN